MSKLVRTVAFGSMLGLGLVLLAGSSTAWAFDDKAEIKKAQKDILDLAKEIAAGKDTASKAAAVKQKYEELLTVMHAYKPSDKGGIGYGKPARGDGIEIKIINLGKRNLAPAALKKEKDELIKLAHINAAIADITMHYAPDKPRGGKTPKDWKQYCADQKKASLDLAKAAQAGNAAQLKAAANNLNNACNSCHSDFRDS